jgi:hypothetical protein
MIVALACAVAPAAAAAVAAGGDDAAVARSLAAMKADGGYQFDLPSVTPPPPRPRLSLPQWLGDLFNWMGGSGQPVMRGIAILFALIIGAAILYMLVPGFRELIDRFTRRTRPAGATDADGDDWRPDAAQARDLLAEADALAAAGRFGDAAHLLLGRSLEDIASRRPGLLRPALTARAIAVDEDLPGGARGAFGRIVAVVEQALWARRAIDAGDWTDARASYEDFAFGPHWRRAA